MNIGLYNLEPQINNSAMMQVILKLSQDTIGH